jgi:hypothetical protein
MEGVAKSPNKWLHMNRLELQLCTIGVTTK